MAVVQDTFNSAPARGYAGMVANGETSNRISRTCEAAGGIAFGAPVYSGSGEHGCTGAQDLTATAAALGTNTGNGAFGSVTVTEGAGVRAGVYVLRVIEPAANAGAFVVEDPDGVQIGDGAIAAAFSVGGLAFTLADGATDFVAGDAFTITVAGTRFLGIAIADHGLQVLPGGTADTYPQYESVGILTAGAILVTAGASVTAGQPVYHDGTDYVASGGTLLSGFVYDESGADGDIVQIARR